MLLNYQKNMDIYNDFLVELGINNPSEESKAKLKEMLTSREVIKPLVVRDKNKGLSLQRLSIKYKITINVVKAMCYYKGQEV